MLKKEYRIRVVVPARQDTQPGGIGFSESILGLFKSLQIRAQASNYTAWRNRFLGIDSWAL
jgi:hypothetical protein